MEIENNEKDNDSIIYQNINDTIENILRYINKIEK